MKYWFCLGFLLFVYFVNFFIVFLLLVIVFNGEVKGGGVYYFILCFFGFEFGGFIGILFYFV